MVILEKAKNYAAEKVANLPRPDATVTKVDLKHFGLESITLIAKVSISNPYAVPIPICEIAYKVKSAEKVIAIGKIPDPGSLKAKGSTILDVTVKVPHSAVVSLLRDIASDWDIDYQLDLGLIIDLPVIGDITIPVSYKGEMKLPTLSEMYIGKKEARKNSGK